MAKSLRASVKKANKTRLRANVFAKVEDARTERLAAKLEELASKPKEVELKDAAEEVPEAETETAAAPADEAVGDDSKMAVDEPEQTRPKRRNPERGIRKKARRKSIVFPVGRKEYKPRSQLPRKKR